MIESELFLSSHLVSLLSQITGVIYFIFIRLVKSGETVEPFLVCKQEVVSLIYSGSQVYSKQLKLGFMALLKTRELSIQTEVVSKPKHSQAQNVF